MSESHLKEINLSRILARAVAIGDQKLIDAALSDLMKHYQVQIEEGVQ